MAPSNPHVSIPTPFPYPEATEPQQEASTSSPTADSPTARRSRTSTNASSISATSRLRTASIKLMEASPPPGMWAATGHVAAKAPTIGEIRGGSFNTSGWNEEQQRNAAERRASQAEQGGNRAPRRTSATPNTQESATRPPLTKNATGLEPFPAVTEEEMSAVPSGETAPVEGIFQTPHYDSKEKELDAVAESKNSSEMTDPKDMTRQQPPIERLNTNGYVPPPKVPWTTSTAIGLKAFWKWFLTPAGFLITIYGLNVVAWGGMLFLLLCNASPAMCHPTCNDIQSPRRIWIEIDSQILNSLFCVTGFGLAPWRFRDLYWWFFWRLGGPKRKQIGIRRLAGIHRGWFRLPGSDNLPPDASTKTVSPEDPAVPIPLAKMADPPPTGIHAPPTKSWKMDFVLWMNASNTFFQIVLCFYMWHYDRYKRPSWATGTFVAMGCIVAGVGGIMIWHEGKYVKKVEGVAVPKGYEDRVDVEAQATRGEVAPTAQGGSTKR